MSSEILVFDSAAIRSHRARAARLPAAHRFLHDEAQARLVDRLEDVLPRFERVLDLGCGDGLLAGRLAAAGREALVVSVDRAPGFARRAGIGVVAEEEALPFAPGSFDLVIATLGLHWTNDLPGALIQLRRALRPDGLLLASLFGGETLWELRQSLMGAELELRGGAAPRVSPFADLKDLGGLLQRAGFALPVADGDLLTVTYPDFFALIRDLRGMGETNSVQERIRHFTPRAVMLRAAELYRDRFGDATGRIPASFQLITLTAWAPAPSQPRPLRPGSAQARLADALGTTEIGTGDPASR